MEGRAETQNEINETNLLKITKERNWWRAMISGVLMEENTRDKREKVGE